LWGISLRRTQILCDNRKAIEELPIMKKSNDHTVIFKTEDDKNSVDVRFDAETAWLTLQAFLLCKR